MYKSTDDQLDKELEVMLIKMRDPQEREKNKLKNKHKQNVKRNTNRYGLNG